MSNANGTSMCQIVCWAIAAVIGLFTLWMVNDAVSFIAALLLALTMTAFLGIVLTRLFCQDELISSGGTMGTEAGMPGAALAESVKETVAPVAEKVADAAAPVAEKAAEAATAAKDKVAEATDATKEKAAGVVSATKEKVADAAGAAKDTVAKAMDGVVKSGTLLSGEEELAGRKGAWKYGDDAATANSAAAAVESTPDYDKDGVREGTEEGTRPDALDGPRDGKADNLKEIKGVGPKLEQVLHSLGFYHFDQIAAWSDDEVAWVDANLKGFKGRVSRDGWVDQAKILAAGGETEFSKRVEDGDVY